MSSVFDRKNTLGRILPSLAYTRPSTQPAFSASCRKAKIMEILKRQLSTVVQQLKESETWDRGKVLRERRYCNTVSCLCAAVMRAVLLLLSVSARSWGRSRVRQFWAKALLLPLIHYLKKEIFFKKIYKIKN